MIKKYLILLTIIGMFSFMHQISNAQMPISSPGQFINQDQMNNSNQSTYCPYSNINSTLWMGNPNNNREEVRTLQKFLFNYYGVAEELTATGYFGRITKNYVSRFQKENGVSSVTGGVGPITRTIIGSLCSNNGNAGTVNYGGDSTGSGNSNGASPANCKVWYDGCNTCSRQTIGGQQICTMMACYQNSPAYCKESFGSNEPGSTINPPALNNLPGNFPGAGSSQICASDAKLCPNGTWVGRSGPNCSFVCE